MRTVGIKGHLVDRSNLGKDSDCFCMYFMSNTIMTMIVNLIRSSHDDGAELHDSDDDLDGRDSNNNNAVHVL